MASAEDKAANKENASSWKDSIYNPRTGELMGRTASSWGKSPSQLVDVLWHSRGLHLIWCLPLYIFEWLIDVFLLNL